MTYDHWKTTNPDDETLGTSMTPYERGWRDCENGAKYVACPFKRSSDEGAEWHRGWHEHDKHFYDDHGFCEKEIGRIKDAFEGFE